MTPHGGLGIRLERFVTKLLDLQNVGKQVCFQEMYIVLSHNSLKTENISERYLK